MAANPLTIVKQIMRDLVNNMQIQVSFSISNTAKHLYVEETKSWDGDLYLGKNIVFWYGDYKDTDTYYFNNTYILLKFLNSLRTTILYNKLNNISYSIVVLIKDIYYKNNNSNGKNGKKEEGDSS